jgi:hypothetical protein
MMDGTGAAHSGITGLIIAFELKRARVWVGNLILESPKPAAVN